MYENGEQSAKEKNRSFFENSKLKIEKSKGFLLNSDINI